MAAHGEPLRARLQRIPALDPTGLRDGQIKAIDKLEASFKAGKPRALIQMATGADLHTILRLLAGIFYAQGVKANVIFFDNRR